MLLCVVNVGNAVDAEVLSAAELALYHHLGLKPLVSEELVLLKFLGSEEDHQPRFRAKL